MPAFQAFAGPTDPQWMRGTMFPPLDGAAAYTAVQKFRPQNIIEIGSGDSTYFLAKNTDANITCIDPEPRRSITELGVKYLPRVLSNDDATLCSLLEPNDILFIDSSHIMLPGMDVDIEFNRIFPKLKSGVVVHIHDIFLPDDYPDEWRVRRYTEQNALVGWLISGYFKVLYPGYYVLTRHRQEIDALLGSFPPAYREGAGSIWLIRN